MKKNFNSNIEKQFNNFQLKLPNHPTNLHYLYADYAELLTLISKTNITPNEVLDRLKDDGASINEDIGDIQNNLTDIIKNNSNIPNINDNKERWMDEIFEVINDRFIMYGNSYPFDYSKKKGLNLKIKLKEKNYLYLYLLISSNLDSFNKVQHTLTSDFENISFLSLKKYLPSSAIIKKFGKNSNYSGNTKDKIENLANEMRLKTNEDVIKNINNKSNKDAGLDIIAWIPFKDSCSNFITILGQCACGKDWSKKQHDTKKFENCLIFNKRDPLHAMFIPFALIYNNDSFYNSLDIEKGTIMFERKRIIELIKNKDISNFYESSIIVDKLINYVEDIV